eukprot:Skav212485  [mRNA]  locus=scaffold385:584863:585342:- [translate_table: standard]
MLDYSKAKIYQVLNDVDDDVYIGATCQSLSMRMAGHRRTKNLTGKNKNMKLYQKMRELGEEHFYIELVEETPCENKEQLRAIEGEYIRSIGTLNHNVAGRTMKQYTEDNKEKKAEYDKKRFQERREEILNKGKQPCQCETCGKTIRTDNLRRHMKTQHS